MNKLIALLLISTQALAGLPPTSIQGQSDASPKTKFNFQAPFNQVTDLGGIKSLIETGNGNILKNAGFEGGTTDWSVVSTGTITTSSTAKGTGALGLEWDDGLGSGAELKSTLITIPEGYKGKNGVVSCQVKQTVGTITQTFTVNNGTTDLFTPILVSANTSTFTDNRNNFIFPTSGSVQVKFYGNNNADPALYIDDCKISLADNIGTVSQALDYGSASYTGTSSCIWTHALSSTVPTSYTANASCPTPTVTGFASAPATKIPALTFSSMGSGTYVFHATGLFSAEINRSCSYFFYDGTTSYPAGTVVGTNASPNTNYTGQSGNTNHITARINVASPQTNKTFEIQGIGENGTSTCQIYADSTPKKDLKIWVEYFPSSSQQAVSSAQADYDWTAYTPTFTGFGTVASSECQHSRVASNLLLRCKFTSGISTAIEARISLPSGLISADTTKIPTIQHAGMASFSVAGADVKQILIEPSVSYVTVSVQGASNAGLTKINGNAFISSGQSMSFSATIPIQGWSSSQRAPTLVGSVTSNSNGAERIERATVDCSTTGSVTSSSSAWLTVGNISANKCAITIPSGTFSSKPTCTCSYEIGSTTSLNLCHLNIISSTSMTVGVMTQTGATTSAGTGVGVNYFDIICMGPR